MRLVRPPLVGKFEIHEEKEFGPRPGEFVAVDTECTGLDPWGRYGIDRPFYPARPFMVQLCDERGKKASVRFPVDPVTRKVMFQNRDSPIRFLTNANFKKIFFNYQYDNHQLEHAGIYHRGEVYDLQIACHIINPDEPSNGLKDLARKYIQIDNEDENDLKESTKKARAIGKKKGYALSEEVPGDYYLADPDLCRIYGELDAYRTMALWLAAKEHFDTDETGNCWRLFKRETELMHVVARMERRGVRIDEHRTKSIIQFYEDLLRKHEAEKLKIVGEEFNPKSPKQMQAYFFGEKGYTPVQYATKRGPEGKIFTRCQTCKGKGCHVCQETGKNPKCDAEFLEKIGVKRDGDNLSPGDPLAWHLLHWSVAHTMRGFCQSYLELKETDDRGDWIIHPNLRQTGTVTGRFSCSSPNLQNVASDESGKKKVNVPFRPRECFIPRKGFIFYVPDYSQIEIWILALLAKSKKMIAGLAAGGDAHQTVADMIWPKAYDRAIAKRGEEKVQRGEKPTDEEKKHMKTKKMIRKRAKNLQFCKVYGGGVGKVALMSETSVAEATQFIDEYDEAFPDVALFMKETVRTAKRQGYVINPYGRKYTIDSRFAYRATNYMVQGTAADLMKSAIVGVDRLARQNYPGRMYPLLTIHDELIIEVGVDIHSEKTMKQVCSAMSEDYKFLGSPIPFPVGMKIAKERWSDSVEVKL